jgi:hypothetical protein
MREKYANIAAKIQELKREKFEAPAANSNLS